MTDGHADAAPGPPMALKDAIALLEAGRGRFDMQVDLGEGRVAKPDGPLGLRGLLQRLKGHRMLAALVEGAGDLKALGPCEPAAVAPEIKTMLDAVKRAR